MRILSGIQPSGALHLGNYFGMMKPAIELQDQGEAFYFIANYHSMTSVFEATERRQRTLDEVGREFGLSRERIRQIEKVTLLKLRAPERAQRLEAYAC